MGPEAARCSVKGCRAPATRRIHWADGRARWDTCDQHFGGELRRLRGEDLEPDAIRTTHLTASGREERPERPFEKEAEERRKSYAAQVISAAPVLAIKALADLPKGAIEDATERGILRWPQHARTSLGAGAGKALGNATIGILTGPLFVSGIKDLQSADHEQKALGVTKVVGASSIYTAGKMTGQAIGGKLPVPTAVGRVFSRTAVGLPVALSTALGVGKAHKEQKGPLVTALYGGAAGAAGGALKGTAEATIERLARTPTKLPPGVTAAPSFARRLGGRAGALAASGALGGLILGALFDRLSKAVEGPKLEKRGAPSPKLIVQALKSEALRPAWIGAGLGAAAGAGTSERGQRLKNALIWGTAGALGDTVARRHLLRLFRRGGLKSLAGGEVLFS